MKIDDLIQQLMMQRQFVGSDAEAIIWDGETEYELVGAFHSTSGGPKIILSAGDEIRRPEVPDYSTGSEVYHER